MTRSAARAALVLALVLAACGTGSARQTTPPAGSTVAVTLSPESAGVDPDGEVEFTATVTGSTDTGVTWSIAEAGGGTVAHGRYKAPTTEGVYHVVATSTADPTKSATAAVTASKIRVAISPTSAAVGGCQGAAFTARLTGNGGGGVNWTVEEGSAGGAVTAAGAYTAPATPGTYHVVATSAADPIKRASATVRVATKVLSVAVTPPGATVAGGATQQLGATVTTTCGTFASP